MIPAAAEIVAGVMMSCKRSSENGQVRVGCHSTDSENAMSDLARRGF